MIRFVIALAVGVAVLAAGEARAQFVTLPDGSLGIPNAGGTTRSSTQAAWSRARVSLCRERRRPTRLAKFTWARTAGFTAIWSTQPGTRTWSPLTPQRVRARRT
jgi:hypothetical protein